MFEIFLWCGAAVLFVAGGVLWTLFDLADSAARYMEFSPQPRRRPMTPTEAKAVLAFGELLNIAEGRDAF